MDTTAILAQPRVPRLRAAVVYVDSWAWLGMVGHGWASSEIDGFVIVLHGAGTPSWSPKP